jgi:hypothetical protein
VHTYVTNTTAPAPRQEQYDQTALELCKECGWRAMIPGDGCLVCARQKAPRQWVGLTEEEVNDCIKLPNRNLFARDGTTSQRIARAIEAKLKEKNDVLRSV